MERESETEPLQLPRSQDFSTFKEYFLGILYAIVCALTYAISLLTIKNVRNARGQHLRPEETLLPRSLFFIISTGLYLIFNKISLVGLGRRTYIILNISSIVTTTIIQCYNLAFYSMSVGDIQTIGFLGLISTMIFERIFRGKKISLWKAVFAIGVVIGGGLVAQPTMENMFMKNNIDGVNVTSRHPLKDVRYEETFLLHRWVGLLIIFLGFNLEATERILISVISDTSPAIIVFHIGLWKLILLPLSQILLPRPGRIFTKEIYDFLQFDLLYHFGASFCMFLSWTSFSLSLRRIPTDVHTVVYMACTLVFDYGGQTLIDGTVPNTMAWIGIVVSLASVTLFLMEEKIHLGLDHRAKPWE